MVRSTADQIERMNALEIFRKQSYPNEWTLLDKDVNLKGIVLKTKYSRRHKFQKAEMGQV